MFLSKTPVLLFLGLVLTGCSHGVAYNSQHDPETDFSQLKTFEWLTGPPEEQGVERDAVLLGLIGEQLQAKGLKRDSQNPDLLISVHRSLAGIVHTKSSGYEFKDGRFSRYQMQEGTLVVDLVLAKNKQGVWRGTASGEFRADAMPEERRVFLTEVVREMFAGYPPKK